MKLFEAVDSRTFLKLALERIQTKNPKFGYAALVRKAGLSSRSFPREVILGKKSLTLDSARKLAQALSLTSDLGQLFLHLVDQDELTRHEKKSEKLTAKIQKLKNRIRQKSEPKSRNAQKIFYEKKGWLEIWAALPARDQKPAGVALTTITSRSGLPAKICESILTHMIEEKLIQQDEVTQGYYIIQSEHLIIEAIGEENFFKSWYLDSLDEVKKNAREHFQSERHLFLNSVFLVQSGDLPKFKKELRELMIRYIDQSEDAEGDTLARLSVSLF